MNARNYASKYTELVDKRFRMESQAMIGLNDSYEMIDGRAVRVPDSNQEFILLRDRAFTFIIDKGEKTSRQMVSEARKALNRMIREVCVPDFDTYVFSTLADKATETKSCSCDIATQENAYWQFKNAMEYLNAHNVPNWVRVCFCSYKFANLLKQNPAFMRYGELSQEVLAMGIIGEVDGCRIVKVSSSRLPENTSFLLTHPEAACAPKQLTEYMIYVNPAGISGWLVEGRLVYDCFICPQNANAIWHQTTPF